MSDALLERIAVAAEGLLAHIKKGAPAAPSAATKGATASDKAAATATTVDADKKAAAARAAAKAAATAAAASADKAKTETKPTQAAGTTKAPGGKYTLDKVREMIRAVANNESLGKQSAADILADDGGAERVADLKPEKYDAVVEACMVLLNNEGAKGGATDDDDLM